MSECDSDPANPEDPVERLLATARGEPLADPFRVTGVMMQYYHVCERELWFEANDVDIDHDNPAIARGTLIDESAYSDREGSLHLGMIAPDLLQDGRIVEVKPSSSVVEPARMQLSYYLWYLERVAGIERDGVLAHPRERRREPVELTPEVREQVESAIRSIHDVVTRDTPPEAIEKPVCNSCAYHDFCWC